MANVEAKERVRVVDVIDRYGWNIEMVTMDPHFHEITVGLYVKEGTFTVWTFSQKPGVEDRVLKIRDQLVALGGMAPVEGTHNQTTFSCGQGHGRPVKFLVMLAVEKDPGYTVPEGGIKDLRSPLMLDLEASEVDGRWVYRVTAEGEAPNPEARLRAVTSGFVRYGEMEKAGDGISFPCRERHDKLASLVLPYARNVTQVEEMLEADAQRTQMTTSTMGFTPPT